MSVKQTGMYVNPGSESVLVVAGQRFLRGQTKSMCCLWGRSANRVISSSASFAPLQQNDVTDNPQTPTCRLALRFSAGSAIKPLQRNYTVFFCGISSYRGTNGRFFHRHHCKYAGTGIAVFLSSPKGRNVRRNFTITANATSSEHDKGPKSMQCQNFLLKERVWQDHCIVLALFKSKEEFT